MDLPETKVETSFDGGSIKEIFEDSKKKIRNSVNNCI